MDGFRLPGIGSLPDASTFHAQLETGSALRRWSARVSRFLACLLAWAGACQAFVMPAKWRDGYVPFSSPDLETILRDPRVVAITRLEYSNCVPVKFVPTARDAAKDMETLWVRILDRDAATDLFLGEVVEKPARWTSVSHHDNVVFRFGSMLEKQPSAILFGDSYLAYPTAMTKFGEAFVAAVAADRELYLGRNTVTLPDAFARTRKAVSLIGATTSRREAFHALYLLGRCHSEAYQVDSAIVWFKSAMAVDSTDPDAAMSLMAEYSVKYSQAFVGRNVSLVVAVKDSMQELSERIRRRDSPDRKFGAMLDQIYACQVPARAARKDPCNTLRYKR
jgi:hypothetical protein